MIRRPWWKTVEPIIRIATEVVNLILKARGLR
jgi:hypothetical protein